MFDARWPFAVALACVALALVPAAPETVSIATSSPSSAAVRASHATGPIVVSAVPDAPDVARLVLYYDPRYARGRAMSERFAAGFVPHMRAALAERSYVARVDEVDADGLRALLTAPARGTCLFIAGGFLPVDVRSRGRDDFAAWLRRGGCAIWMGTPFDAYFALRGTASEPGGFDGPDISAWPELYGAGGPLRTAAHLLSQTQTYGATPSAVHDAIALTFDSTTFAVDARALERIGGTPIGYIDDAGRSSVSVVPLVAGRAIIFGDAEPNELSAAQELAQIIATGAWYDPRSLLVAGRLDPQDEVLRVRLPSHHHAFAFGAPPYYSPWAR